MNAPFISAFNFTAYGMIKRMFSQDSTNLNLSTYLFAGSLTGIGSATINTPLDFIKCRLQIEGMRNAESSSGVFSLAGKVWKQSGLKGVFRGYTLCLMRDVPGTAILFTTYDLLKRKIREDYEDAFHLNLIAGGISSFLMWFFIYPQDVIKTRYQLSETMTLREITKDIWNRGGILGFYKGIQLVLCHSLVSGSCSFFVMDKVRTFLEKSSH